MGVPVQVVLDVPPDIAAGIANGTNVRTGGVIRDPAGHIVKHLKETSVLPEQEVGRLAAAARSVWRSTSGKVIVFAGALTLAATLVFVRDRMKSKCLVDDLNASLSSYIEAAQRAELTVEHIDGLSGAVERARERASRESGSISEKVVELVEDYTLRLAEANATSWEPEPSAETGSLIRLEHSLKVQRQILGAAA